MLGQTTEFFNQFKRAGILAAGIVFGAPITAPAVAAPACDLSASVETFPDVINNAAPGQTICLSSGHYGIWHGIDKAITLTKLEATSATIILDVNKPASGFTIDGLTVAGGRIAGVRNVTFKNSEFTEPLIIDFVENANVLLDNNRHVNININNCSKCPPAAIFVPHSSDAFSGVTIQNSLFKGGNADGIQAGAGVNIIGNTFIDISEHGSNELHTDPIQLLGAKGSVVRGNYIYNCAVGIVAYNGLNSATIEDNVIDLVSGRWGIEINSDINSVIRHNTLVYRNTCAFAPCGHIYLGRVEGLPPGRGTVIENNIATVVSYSDGSIPAVNRNNMVRQRGMDHNFIGVPEYVGGDVPKGYEGYALAQPATEDGKSPVGIRPQQAKRN